MEHGIVNLKSLVSHVFPLERAVEALETAADRQAGSVKVHVEDREISS